MLFQRFVSTLERSPLYHSLLVLWGRLPIPKGLRWLILWAGIQKFLVGITAVILNERGEVLLFKHTYRPEYPWGLPGGWLKRGEDPLQAIAREIREESGMKIEILGPLYARQRDDYPGFEVTYLGRWVSGEFHPSPEVSEGRFFPRDQLPPLYEEVQELLETLWERIE